MEILQKHIPTSKDVTRTYTVFDLGNGDAFYQAGVLEHNKGMFKEKVSEYIGKQSPVVLNLDGVDTEFNMAVVSDIVETSKAEIREKGFNFIIKADGSKISLD